MGHTQQQTVLPKFLPPSSRRDIDRTRRPVLLEEPMCPSGGLHTVQFRACKARRLKGFGTQNLRDTAVSV